MQYDTNLHLNTLTINKFDGRHNGVEQYGAFLARIEENAVNFALDGDGRVLAFEHVDHIVHFSIVNEQIWIRFLVLDEPFLAVSGEYWRLSGCSRGCLWGSN